MTRHTEADLMRSGGWSSRRRCFDVGVYHVNVYADGWRFFVVIWRGPRIVYEVVVTGPMDTPNKGSPQLAHFRYAATKAIEDAGRRMLIDAILIGPDDLRYAPC